MNAAGLLALALGAAFATGCGQEVATCSSICTPPGTSAGCASDCSQLETQCTASGGAADFQLLLTCFGNAGGFTVGDTACAGLVTLVNRECGAPSEGGTTVGAGRGPGTGAGTGLGAGTAPGMGTGTGTGTGGEVDAICVTLGPCCSSLPSPGAEACAQAVATNDQPACITFLQDIGGGFCAPGGGASDCVAGGPCVAGDSCGFGTGDCSETCSCLEGVMACTGNCP